MMSNKGMLSVLVILITIILCSADVSNTKDSVGGNDLTFKNQMNISPNSVNKEDGFESVTIFAITSAVGGGLLLLIVVIALCVHKNQKKETPSGEEASDDVQLNDQVYDKLFIKGNISIDQPTIGSGQFGQVFRGTYVGAPVALKSLKAENDIRAFMKEATLMSNLRHPHVVKFLGIYCSPDNELYIATNFIKQGSLKGYMKLNASTFSLQDLLALAWTACDGMTYLHDRNIIHGDLAMRNLLVTSPGPNGAKFKALVSDFGMAQVMKKQMSRVKAIPESLPVKWCAPETITSYHFSKGSDSWSMGITLWEIFSYGQTPYTALSNAEVLPLVQTGHRLQRPDVCPTEIWNKIEQCWSLIPDQRPSMRELMNFFCDRFESCNPAATNPLGEELAKKSPPKNAYSISDVEEARRNSPQMTSFMTPEIVYN